MTVLAILTLANGLATLIPMLLVDALKFKELLQPLSPNIQVNITTLDGIALNENKEAMDGANAWLVANGYPPMTSGS